MVLGHRRISVMAVLCALAVFSSVWTTGPYTHDDTRSVSQGEIQHQKAVSFMDVLNKAQARLAQGETYVETLLDDGLYLVSRVTKNQSVGRSSLMTKGRDASSPPNAITRFSETFHHEVKHPLLGLVLGFYVSVVFEKTLFRVTPISIDAYTRGLTRRRSPHYQERITTWLTGPGGAKFEISGSQFMKTKTNGVFICTPSWMGGYDVRGEWR